ncbi:MAG: nuclear transport factor 2 family protein [Alphaproteobacteria bacterium]
MPDTNLTPEQQDFYERFKSFWAAPSGARVPEVIAPDAKIHFTGAGIMSGAEYADWMGETLPQMEDMTVTPLDCAGNGDMLYIAWETSALIHGERRVYRGVDRFRLKDGMAIEEHVIFDSAVLTPEGRGGIEQ